MFFNKGNTSIRRQLIQIQVVIAVLVILLVTIIGIANSIYHFKKIQKDNLTWLADFIANNNSMGFDESYQQGVGFGTLNESIDRQKTVENVALYNKKAVEIHSYTKKNLKKYTFTIPIEELNNTNQPGLYEESWTHTTYYHIYKDHREGNATTGFLCIRANKEELYSILLKYASLAMITLVLLIALAYTLAVQLQKSISEPIEKLNLIVSKFGKLNFEEKAPLEGNTELIELANSFNKMAEQIKVRDKKLVEANENLNEEVTLQTAQLNKNVQSLEKQRKELYIKNKELEQFAYIASHDLQEPLRTIGSFTQLLERKVKKTEAYDKQGQEYFEYIVKGVKRMQAVINDVLLFSGIKEKPNFVATDLNQVVADSLNSIKAIIDEKQAIIKIPHTLPIVEIDDKQIPHIFQNLISNGIKFNKNIPPEITIGFYERGDFWHFYIKDNGIGIEPEYVDKIFQMFKRLHSIEEYPGTGIGLAICKKVVEYHEGKLWVESEPNKGSVFNFTIRKNLEKMALVNNTELGELKELV